MDIKLGAVVPEKPKIIQNQQLLVYTKPSVTKVSIDEVKTLGASEDAYVESIQSNDVTLLKFGIPRGEKGEKGEKGVQGIQGIQGVQGPQGERGESGLTLLIHTGVLNNSSELPPFENAKVGDAYRVINASGSYDLYFKAVDGVNWDIQPNWSVSVISNRPTATFGNTTVTAETISDLLVTLNKGFKNGTYSVPDDKTITYSIYGYNELNEHPNGVIGGYSIPFSLLKQDEDGVVFDTINIVGYDNAELKFIGETDATYGQPLFLLTQKRSEYDVTANISNIKFSNYQGYTTSWELNYIEFEVGYNGTLSLNNCSFVENGLILKCGIKYSIINCQFKSIVSSKYCLWIGMNAYGQEYLDTLQNVTVDNCTFTGYRGIKILTDTETTTTKTLAYKREEQNIVIQNCTFKDITQKPGIVIDSNFGTSSFAVGKSKLSVNNSTFVNCAASKETGRRDYGRTDVAIESGQDFDYSINNSDIYFLISKAKHQAYYNSVRDMVAIWGDNDGSVIIIEEGVTEIEDDEYTANDNIKLVIIPYSVTSIGDSAFYDCSSLTSVTIPDSVTSIGEDAFHNCSSLTSIEIPYNVTSIGLHTFHNCNSLMSITVSENNKAYKSIDGNLYSKNGTTLIKYAAAKTITSFDIPDTVTSIRNWAVHNCSNLMNITIPGSVKSIGAGAFNTCRNLKEIEIPSGVTLIGQETFTACSSLTSVTIPDSVTSIGDYAFRYCTKLNDITIPNNVTYIGTWTFHNCESLTEINFKGTKAQWNAIEKREYWNSNVPATKVVCSDGEVSL